MCNILLSKTSAGTEQGHVLRPEVLGAVGYWAHRIHGAACRGWDTEFLKSKP